MKTTTTLLTAEQSATTARKNYLKWVWHGAVIALVVLAAWKYIDFRTLINALSAIQPTFILLIFLVITFDRFVMTAKWSQLLRAISLNIQFRVVLSAYYQSTFIGRIIPSSLSGDILRGYIVTRKVVAWERVLGSMVMEKSIGILASAALATIGVLILSTKLQQEGLTFIIFAIPTIAAMTALGFFFSLSERIGTTLLGFVRWERMRRPLTKLHKAYCLYNGQWKKLLINFFLALGEQALQIFYLWLCAIAINVDVPLMILVPALALSQFLRKAAIVLEGWALGEFILVLTCVLVGIDQTQVLAFSLLSHAIGILASVPGGILLLLSRPIAGSCEQAPQPCAAKISPAR